MERVNWGLEEDENREEGGVMGQLPSMNATEEANRKERKSHESLAKKAAKQKKKALGDRGEGAKQAEGDHEGGSQDLLGQDQLANEAEEEEGESSSQPKCQGELNLAQDLNALNSDLPLWFFTSDSSWHSAFFDFFFFLSVFLVLYPAIIAKKHFPSYCLNVRAQVVLC